MSGARPNPRSDGPAAPAGTGKDGRPRPGRGGAVVGSASARDYRAVAPAAGAGARPAGRVVNVPRPWVRLRNRVA